MKKAGFLGIALLLSALTSGCSHYTGSMQLTKGMSGKLQKEIAVAGVLDRRGLSASSPAIAQSATRLLVEEAKMADVSGKLKVEELSLLLSQPVELAVAIARTRELKQRLGIRYAVVGEQGADSLTESSFWTMAIVVPTPVLITSFSIPIAISQQPGVKHATRLLRIIDLEQGEIVSEHYELLRDLHDSGEFTRSEIADGLSSMKLAKE